MKPDNPDRFDDRSEDKDREQLRQDLLELHYELLDDPQTATLRHAIETDPEVAAMWAATLRLAGKFADAAKIDSANTGASNTGASKTDPASSGKANVATWIDLAASPPSANGRPHSDETPSSDRPSVSLATGSPSRRWWVRSTGLAATAAAIGMLVIGSWYGERLPRTPQATVLVEARPVPVEEAESDHQYHLVTKRMDDSSRSIGSFPVTPASVSFSVLARGTVLFSGTATTDQQGAGEISLPPELVIPRDATLHVVAKSEDGRLSESHIEVPLEPTRCLTFLTVDRPVYRPGETVFFRSLTLQRRSLRANADVPIRYELIDPSGATVAGAFSEGVTDLGVGNGAFSIPSTAPGGAYALVAKSLDEVFPEERCEFQVRAYRVPRFKKELEFRKRSYGAGERVEADFSAIRAEGGPLVDASVSITATIDDEVVFQSTATTSSSGTCLLSFDLPTLIRIGSGQLSVTIDDGGTRETMTKTIPIQIGRVVVDFYPEGGYLVDGLTNRVYFTARDTLGNPIDIAGEVLNRSGQNVATIETVRDGMGRFTIVPRRGERYTLKVTRPVDVANNPKLPAVVKDLPVIDTGVGVFEAGQPISMSIRNTRPLSTIVRAVCRGQLVGEAKVQLHAGGNTLSMPIQSTAGGVIRVTVFDNSTLPPQPLTERLVYRRQARNLQVEIVDRESVLERSPGEPLRMTLQVRDETGEPTPAVLGVSVVDDAALSLDPHERPQLRTHFLLTSEIEKPEDLEHANFYLSDDPDAAESLDLLLGTQGWRRFVSGDSRQANVDFRDQLIRLLELDGTQNVDAVARFDSSGSLATQWEKYRGAVQSAWNRMLYEARTLMLVVLGIWLLVIVFHLRRQSRAQLAGWLLVASTSLLIYGCGHSVDSMVVSSEADQRTSENAAKAMGSDDSMADYEVSSAMTPPGESRDESSVDDAMQAELGADAGIDMGMAAPNVSRPADPAVESAEESDPGHDVIGAMKYRAVVGAKDEMLGSAGRLITKDDLSRLLAARGLDAETLADQLIDELRFPVRQYAHHHTPSDDGVRHDFAETLFWQPLLITDSQGRATIRFDLSDSVTTFRVNIDGHSSEGRIGSGSEEITARLPFQIEPKLPLEVTTGDQIRLPIAVINATDTETKVLLTVTADSALKLSGETLRPIALKPHQRLREHVTLDVGHGLAEQDATIEIRGSGDQSLSDSVRRSIHVSPAGYPTRHSIAGKLNDRVQLRLPIPEDLVEGSLAVTVRAYPSPIADVMSGIASILSEPHGCFEQTSATNYPNTMALQYLRDTQTANPEVSRRALGMLDRGYQKLVSFECDKLGYEWFGSDPGHEALSAFGLMQFTDMSNVMEVSQAMIGRTRKWLLARRDGQGGFQRNPRHLHVWSVQQEIVNAYVLWAITEADVSAGQPLRATRELAAELDRLNRVATESDDPYLIALSAATLMNVRRTEDGTRLLEKLARSQRSDGSVHGKTTVTSSGGLSLIMESTAIATLAWAKSPRFRTHAQQAAKWIAANRLGNAGFGSTQATVLALKAMLAVADGGDGQVVGTLQVMLDGQVIGQAKLPDDPRSGDAVEITGLGSEFEELRQVKRELEFELVSVGTKDLSYTVNVACHVLTPDSDDECPLRIDVRLHEDSDSGDVIAGDLLKVSAKLTNTATHGLPMTVAIVGLPGGVEPRAEELEELQAAGRFDYYETRGRELIFYWRTIEPNAIHELDFHVTATIPGKYTGPASRTYLYYTAEQKQWFEPIRIEIQP